MYGLKQRPRNWQNTVKSVLIKLSFQSLISDESVYYNKDLNTYIITYVDDFLLIGPEINKINSIKNEINKYFKIHDLGPISYFLGIQIIRNRPARQIQINQSNYIQNILKNFDFMNLKPSTIPMDPGLPKQHYKETIQNNNTDKNNNTNIPEAIKYY